MHLLTGLSTETTPRGSSGQYANCEYLININVPCIPFNQIKGARITRLGRRIYRDELVERQDPSGRNYYWIGGQPPTGATEEEGTDVWAIAHQFVSITPVHLDMTSHALVARLQEWENLFQRSSFKGG